MSDVTFKTHIILENINTHNNPEGNTLLIGEIPNAKSEKYLFVNTPNCEQFVISGDGMLKLNDFIKNFIEISQTNQNSYEPKIRYMVSIGSDDIVDNITQLDAINYLKAYMKANKSKIQPFLEHTTEYDNSVQMPEHKLISFQNDKTVHLISTNILPLYNPSGIGITDLIEMTTIYIQEQLVNLFRNVELYKTEFYKLLIQNMKRETNQELILMDIPNQLARIEDSTDLINENANNLITSGIYKSKHVQKEIDLTYTSTSNVVNISLTLLINDEKLMKRIYFINQNVGCFFIDLQLRNGKILGTNGIRFSTNFGNSGIKIVSTSNSTIKIKLTGGYKWYAVVESDISIIYDNIEVKQTDMIKHGTTSTPNDLLTQSINGVKLGNTVDSGIMTDDVSNIVFNPKNSSNYYVIGVTESTGTSVNSVLTVADLFDKTNKLNSAIIRNEMVTNPSIKLKNKINTAPPSNPWVDIGGEYLKYNDTTNSSYYVGQIVNSWSDSTYDYQTVVTNITSRTDVGSFNFSCGFGGGSGGDNVSTTVTPVYGTNGANPVTLKLNYTRDTGSSQDSYNSDAWIKLYQIMTDGTEILLYDYSAPIGDFNTITNLNINTSTGQLKFKLQTNTGCADYGDPGTEMEGTVYISYTGSGSTYYDVYCKDQRRNKANVIFDRYIDLYPINTNPVFPWNDYTAEYLKYNDTTNSSYYAGQVIASWSDALYDYQTVVTRVTSWSTIGGFNFSCGFGGGSGGDNVSTVVTGVYGNTSVPLSLILNTYTEVEDCSDTDTDDGYVKLYQILSNGSENLIYSYSAEPFDFSDRVNVAVQSLTGQLKFKLVTSTGNSYSSGGSFPQGYELAGNSTVAYNGTSVTYYDVYCKDQKRQKSQSNIPVIYGGPSLSTVVNGVRYYMNLYSKSQLMFMSDNGTLNVVNDNEVNLSMMNEIESLSNNDNTNLLKKGTIEKNLGYVNINSILTCIASVNNINDNKIKPASISYILGVYDIDEKIQYRKTLYSNLDVTKNINHEYDLSKDEFIIKNIGTGRKFANIAIYISFDKGIYTESDTENDIISYIDAFLQI